MKIHSIEIEGFRSYGDKQVIKFEDDTLYIITGQNRDRGVSSAAGKSTIFKALTTALFEENDDNSVEDRAINSLTKDGCRIAVNFSSGGTEYCVVYARKHKEEGTHWTLFRWNGDIWESEQGARLKDTKKLIHDKIKMTYEQFVNQAYIPQSKVADFIERTDKERKEVFSDILQLADCEAFLKKAKELRMEAEKETIRGKAMLENIEVQIMDIAKFVQAINIQDVQQKLDLKIANVQTYTHRLTGIEQEIHQLRGLNTLREKATFLNNRLTYYNTKNSELWSELAQMTTVEIDTLFEESSDLKERLGRHGVALSYAKDRLEKIESLSSKCGECEQPVDDKTRETLISRYKKDVDIYEMLMKEINEQLEKVSTSLTEGKSQNNTRIKIEAEIMANTKQIQAATKEQEEVTSKMEDMKNIFGVGPDILLKLEKEQKTLHECHVNDSGFIGALNEQILSYQKNVNDLKLSKDRLAVVKESVQKNEAKVAYLKRCEELLGNKGFKAFKIESSKEIFNNSLAKYLSVLSDGEVHAELVTEVPSSDGKKLKSELDIIVSDGAKKNIPIKQYSGGEKSTISLAITGAFGDLALHQSESNVNLLLLDEPFANLDNWQEEKVCGLFESLAKDGRIVMVITNHRSVKDKGKFDREICAVKENHITHIEERDLRGEH